MKYLMLLLGVLFTYISGLNAQTFNHLTVEDGLSQSSVMAIAQDKSGMMWFGTNYGINRYDAKDIKVYHNHFNALSDDYVVSLFCDTYGTLWAGNLRGLNRYNKIEDKFEQYSFNTSGRTGPQAVSCIAETKRRALLIAAHNSLYISGAGQHRAFKFFQDLPGEIKCLLVTKGNVLYAGTTKGLFVIEGAVQKRVTVSPVLADGYITSLAEDRSGNLWVGTSGDGLLYMNPRINNVEQFVHADSNPQSLISNNIRKILIARDNKVWIGTQDGISVKEGSGKYFRNYQHNKNDNNSLSQNSIHSLFEDKDRTVWIGTFFGGINTFSNYSTPFSINKYGGSRLTHTTVSSVIEDQKHNLWIGTEGSGLNYVNRSTGQVNTFVHKNDDRNSISSNLIKAIYRDKDDHIWIGTHAGGLNLFIPDKQSFRHYLYDRKDPNSITSEITSINEDNSGGLWVGTQKGIVVYKRIGETLTLDPVKQQLVDRFNEIMVLFVYKDSRNQLWFGTEDGLFRLQNGRLYPANKPKSNMVTFRINCINEDSEGHIWVGSYHNGLHCYNSTGKIIRSFSRQDGLSDNNVVGILEDKRHDLWISTGNGLCRSTGVDKQFLQYYAVDCLAGNVFNNNSFYRTSQGELLFGGYNGLSSFMPLSIRENKTPPVVRFTSLSLFGKAVTANDDTKLLNASMLYTSSLTFAPSQNAFTVGISVLNFVRPEKNRFAYRLLGFNKGWEYPAEPSIVFNNLAPGDYTLMAKGSNNDGHWSAPVSLKIHVLPTFWKTWIAYMMYAIIAATIILLFFRYILLRESVKKDKELTQYKLNFFTSVSHEIRTHLALIIGPTDYLMRSRSLISDDEQQLRVIKNNSNSLLQLVNELMDFRHAEAGHLKLQLAEWDMRSFLQEIQTSYHNISLERNIILDLVLAEEPVLLWFDRVQLEKVIYNLLSNAFKFTPNGGSIRLSVEQTTDDVIIKVIDNGRGLSDAETSKIFDQFYQGAAASNDRQAGYGIGLALAKAIIELHNGTITANSIRGENNEGTTCFTLKLRKGVKHLPIADLVNSLPTGSPSVTNMLNTDIGLTSVQLNLEESTDTPMVLLVDDNADIRRLITQALNKGYQFVECENGIQGLQQAVELMPDLIISDVMMPELDGTQLCDKLKADPRTNHIPIILLTAKTTVENQITGLQSGADLYLPKPFNVNVLALAMQNMLASRKYIWKHFQESLNASVSKDAQTFSDTVSMHPLDAAFIEKLTKIIENNMIRPDFNIAELSSEIGMSQPVLLKKIKAITGLSTNEFVKSIRLKKAANLFSEKRYAVYEVSYMVGYEDSKYFSKEFKKFFGKLPSEFQV